MKFRNSNRRVPIPPRRVPPSSAVVYRHSHNQKVELKTIIFGFVGVVVCLSIGALILYFVLPRNNVNSITQLGETPSAAITVENNIVSTTSTSSVSMTPASSPTAVLMSPDIYQLQNYMLSLVNKDRDSSNVAALLWNNAAAQAGIAHANEMAKFGFVNHWNLDGFGPDSRFFQVKGSGCVQENVYGVKLSDSPSTQDEWLQVIDDAYHNLVIDLANRENILAPEHTHIGIGISYNPDTRWLAIDQELVTQQVVFESDSFSPDANGNIIITGKIQAENIQLKTINIFYESLPSSLSLSQLMTYREFRSPAKLIQEIPISQNTDGRFEANIKPGFDMPGLYHVRFIATISIGTQIEICANEIIFLRSD